MSVGGLPPPGGSFTGGGGAVANTGVGSNRVPPAFSPGRFVAWLGALAVLWLILSAFADSGNADVARALAGLILFGAVMALGPGALAEAKALVQQPGG